MFILEQHQTTLCIAFPMFHLLPIAILLKLDGTISFVFRSRVTKLLSNTNCCSCACINRQRHTGNPSSLVSSEEPYTRTFGVSEAVRAPSNDRHLPTSHPNLVSVRLGKGVDQDLPLPSVPSKDRFFLFSRTSSVMPAPYIIGVYTMPLSKICQHRHI